MTTSIAAVMAVATSSGNEKILNDGNDVFTANFMSEVVKEKEGKSVVMSAFSVLQPLAQLALASVGESHDQLLKTIGLPDDTMTAEVFPEVNKQLHAIKGVELKMASKIYIPLDGELQEEFRALSKSVFGSEVEKVNFFEPEKTANDINAWVENHTNKRIKNLISKDGLGPQTRAVLINALYFKGTWLQTFNKANTIDRDFYVTKDNTVKVPTMYKKAYFKYSESAELDAELLELPYKGNEASLLIVLPNRIDGINGLVGKLKDPANLEKATSNMYSHEIHVYLPKFKIETTIDLKKVLMNLGVTHLFNAGTARLENLMINSPGLYVSDAIQKAFIEVNEEGAEAAAANAITGDMTLSLRAYRPVLNFKADHPFVFYLKHGARPLFNGVVTF